MAQRQRQHTRALVMAQWVAMAACVMSVLGAVMLALIVLDAGTPGAVLAKWDLEGGLEAVDVVRTRPSRVIGAVVEHNARVAPVALTYAFMALALLLCCVPAVSIGGIARGAWRARALPPSVRYPRALLFWSAVVLCSVWGVGAFLALYDQYAEIHAGVAALSTVRQWVALGAWGLVLAFLAVSIVMRIVAAHSALHMYVPLFRAILWWSSLGVVVALAALVLFIAWGWNCLGARGAPTLSDALATIPYLPEGVAVSVRSALHVPADSAACRMYAFSVFFTAVTAVIEGSGALAAGVLVTTVPAYWYVKRTKNLEQRVLRKVRLDMHTQ